MVDTTIHHALSAEAMATVHHIREQVFIHEQGVLPSEEWDALDATALHYLARVEGEDVATARIRRIQEKDGRDYGKIERVAVLPSHRGLGIGYQLMQRMIEEALEDGMTDIRLEAQTQALAFYQRLGFEAYGESYMDARITHRRMKLLVPEMS